MNRAERFLTRAAIIFSVLSLFMSLSLFCGCAVGEPIPGGPGQPWEDPVEHPQEIRDDVDVLEYNDEGGPCYAWDSCEVGECVGWGRDPFVTICAKRCEYTDECDGDCIDGRCHYLGNTVEECRAYGITSPGFEFIPSTLGDPAFGIKACGWRGNHPQPDELP